MGVFREHFRRIIMEKTSVFTRITAVFGVLILSFGCAKNRPATPESYAAAKALFEQTSKEFHIPSAEAGGAEKLRLQRLAEAGYRNVLNLYPQEDYWTAQALRSLGNIYAAQTNVDAAVKEYLRVEESCPQREWEVLMAWKSAADLLWETERFREARPFYAKIVQRFDRQGASQVVATVVRGSKQRLSSLELRSA
jgi:tetratricopeptide (TPR) repeat protein